MNIFICYRREDTAPYAGRLYDRLRQRFGRRHVFIDIDTLIPGDDFVTAIEEKVAACDIVMVLIGPRWLANKDAVGRRRIDVREDLVRLEIASALKRGIRVVPVLVDGTSMPAAAELPSDLEPLVRRQAQEISNSRFHEDANRLIEAISGTRQKSRAHVSLWVMFGWVSLATLVIVMAVVGFRLYHSRPGKVAPSEGSQPRALSEVWVGAWDYVCETKRGPIRGRMLLKMAGQAEIVGEYSDATVNGTIEGRVGDLPDSITGKWKNMLGQAGQFQFKLRPGGTSFEGHYSMSIASAPPEDANGWNGSHK